MRVVSCKFNPKRDVAPVEQDGYVDLVQAFKDGVIPSGVNVGDSEELPCKESDSLLPPPGDVFEQIQQVHSVRSASESIEPAEAE